MQSQPVPRHPDEKRPPLGFLIIRIGEALDRAFVTALTDRGLKPRHFRLLVLVDRAGGLYQRQLAEQLRVDPGNLVATLDSLEAQGLVARPRGEEDRRQRVVTLTPKGRRALAKALGATTAIDEQILDALPAAQRELYYEMTLAIYDRM